MNNISVRQIGQHFHCRIPNVFGEITISAPYGCTSIREARAWFVGWCRNHNFHPIDEDRGHTITAEG